MARITFASEKAKNTSRSEHFLKLRCRKSAVRCGAKHISKSKCTKHTILAQLLEIEMSKKCTPLWREAHFEVEMSKAPRVRTTFGRSDVVLRGRRKGLCTLSKVSKKGRFCIIFNYNHHYTPIRYTTTTTTPSLHSTTLHYTPPHSTTLHYIRLHCTTLQLQQYYIYTTLSYTRLH